LNGRIVYRFWIFGDYGWLFVAAGNPAGHEREKEKDGFAAPKMENLAGHEGRIVRQE